MGSHPSVPSYIKPPGPVPAPADRQALGPYLLAHPALLSEPVIHKYGIDLHGTASRSPLPFLFKVLSVGKALSIQAHPDKPLAERLHAARPDVYKDDNHKPEMAVAITEFHGFCGFRPLGEIVDFLRNVHELRQLVVRASVQREGETQQQQQQQQPDEEQLMARLSAAADPQAEAEEHTAALRTVFEAVMTAPEPLVRQAIESLLRRYATGPVAACEARGSPSAKEEILTLQEQFPYDVGLLCTFLLNNVRLAPGDALYLGAGEPHAYLVGEITECMAASDNVVRAGLTPKLRDTPTLVRMLTYDDAPAEQKRMTPRQFHGSRRTLLYQPPIDEFRILRTTLPPGESDDHAPIAGPSVLIVTHGTVELAFPGGMLRVPEGGVAFVAPNIPLVLSACATDSRPASPTGHGNANGSKRDAVAFRAYVEAP